MDNLRSGVLLIAAGVGLFVFWWSGAAGALVGDLTAGIRSGGRAAVEPGPATASPSPAARDRVSVVT